MFLIPVFLCNIIITSNDYFSFIYSPNILFTTYILSVFLIVYDILLKLSTSIHLSLNDMNKTNYLKTSMIGILFVIVLCIIIIISSNCFNNNNLISHVKNKNFNAALLYLMNNADVDCEVKNSSILIIAVNNNDNNMVELLIDFGANPDITNFNKQNALHLAVIYKNVEMVKDIVWAQDNINALDKFGYSALHYAASNQSNDIVSILIINEAKVNIRADKSGITPLHSACSHEDYQSVSILLSAGADINFQDKLKQTPLYRAGVNNNHPNMVSYLIDHGADINNKDVYGLTVLDYAKRYRYKEVIEILEKEKRRKYTDVLRGR